MTDQTTAAFATAHDDTRLHAIVFGASGLVGQHLCQQLLEHPGYLSVTSVTRRPFSPLDLPANNDARHARHHNLIYDFNLLLAEDGPVNAQQHQTLQAALDKAQQVFFCLGTTMKQAGSREAFERVDLTYTVQLAKLARAYQIEQAALISALGSNLQSSFFYSRTKARCEQALLALGFERLVIARPSLLLGQRSQSRPGEDWAQRILPIFAPCMIGSLRAYRPIAAEQVARGILRALQQPASTMTQKHRYLYYDDFIR